LIPGPAGLVREATEVFRDSPVNPPPSLIDLRSDVGTELPRGTGASTNTRFFALTITDANDMPPLVEAVLSVSDAAKDLQWSGGLPVSNPSKRLIIANQVGKFVVSCSLGGVTKTAVIYVVGAEQTDFRGDGGGVFHPDNLPSLKLKGGRIVPTKGLRTGRNIPPLGSNFGFNDFCETQYTLKPDEFVADANAGLFEKTNIKWLLTREKQTQAFLGDEESGTWVTVVNDATFVDDTDEVNQMLDPWSANGHLYSNDGPGFLPLVSKDAANLAVFKNRLQERVKVTFDGSSPKTGSTCSQQFQWHDFRSFKSPARGVWLESTSFGGNELIKGDKPLGPPPQ
jgi:hypothetical protein